MQDDRTIVKKLWPDSRPSWSDVTSAGSFRVEPDGRSDRHFHDCDEYGVLEGFRFEARTPPGGRSGHVHRTAEDSQGQVVPAMSRENLPA